MLSTCSAGLALANIEKMEGCSFGMMSTDFSCTV
jgi:hypothetical protein